MPAKVWLLNLIVLVVLLEAGLGRRKIGWFRVGRAVGALAFPVTAFGPRGQLLSAPAAGQIPPRTVRPGRGGKKP